MSKLKKALQKANDQRIVKRQVSDKDNLGVKKSSSAYSQDDKNEEINVTYTKTKVLDIDPSKFKSNKIIAQIKENEMSEQINMLRTQIVNKLAEIDGNTIMVTSCHPREGKTFTSINLGVSIARELEKTVLLVDCDLRKPDKNHFDFAKDYFNVNVKYGLSDYLVGQIGIEDILLNPGIPRLTILPGGKSILNSSELLGSQRMKKLVHEMKERYGKSRIIIFDSPSIMTISDPLAFSKYVDGILLVVEAGRTSKSDIRKVIELLSNRVLIGITLNKVKIK